MPDNLRLDPFLVAAGEACVRLRSSRNPTAAITLKNRGGRFYDRFAAERSLRQLLQTA